MSSSSSSPMFPASRIPTAVASTLPAGYTMRPLQRTDYTSGMLTVLADLTTVGDITADEWAAQYDEMARAPKDTYLPIVITDAEGRVVALGHVLVERKFIHHCGRVGHIEDIAVLKDQQGKSLGKKIIAALVDLAKQAGCYKVILDCSEGNVGFYEKCGFTKKEHEMAMYLE